MTHDANALAQIIDMAIRDALMEHEYDLMRLQNTSDEYRESDSCASHNFCDTNHYACAAFEFLFKREPDLSSDEDLSLITDALDIAHRVFWTARIF